MALVIDLKYKHVTASEVRIFTTSSALLCTYDPPSH